MNVADIGTDLSILNLTIVAILILVAMVLSSRYYVPEPLPNTSFCWYTLESETKQE